MFPIGSYERLYYDILKRYKEYTNTEYVTFGILIADPRQTEAREYILNYLDIFNRESGKFFDFFIPGYFQEFYESDYNIQVGNITYGFNVKLFNEFCNNLKNDFDIQYTFNPMLILMSMPKGDKNRAQFVIIELDDYNDYGIRRSGELFLKIFSIAKADNRLCEINNELRNTYIKGNAIESIINAIGSDWLSEITKKTKEINRYKIKRRI